jgi:hypothetical protein
MGADFRALFHDDDGKLGIDLLQPDRRRQTRRTGADDDNVIIHRLARLQSDIAHLRLQKAGSRISGEISRSLLNVPDGAVHRAKGQMTAIVYI